MKITRGSPLAYYRSQILLPGGVNRDNATGMKWGICGTCLLISNKISNSVKSFLPSANSLQRAFVRRRQQRMNVRGGDVHSQQRKNKFISHLNNNENWFCAILTDKWNQFVFQVADRILPVPVKIRLAIDRFFYFFEIVRHKKTNYNINEPELDELDAFLRVR